ncbi:MAG: transporter substrate-binding domain-containing protein [Syntrophobacteraceae bacterium]|nr:transporter substrate-binding domain-containing protein [Syntrophobacteraceae bacterium]
MRLPGIFIVALLASVFAAGHAMRGASCAAHDDGSVSFGADRGHPEPVQLTEEEASWLRQHPSLRLGVDPAWPPYEFVDSMGRYRGIAADYVRLISARLSIVMEVQPGLSWEQVLSGLEKKEVDVSPAITRTPERGRFLLFTEPHVKYSVAIVTRLDHASVAGLVALAGRKVALVKGYAFTELALAKQPDLVPIYVDTVLEGLDKVSNGEAEAMVSDLPSLSYKISEYNFLNLKVAGITPFRTEGLSIGVRSDWPILVSILDKALASITPEEHQEIRRRWITLPLSERDSLDLSPEELDWLARHPVIRNALDPDWAPIEFIDEQGRRSGFTSEYLDRLERMLQVTFETPGDMSWGQMMDALREGSLDMASSVRNTPQRRSFMEFTEPYLSMPTAIFTRTDVSYADLASLNGRRVAVVEGYALEDLIGEAYPEIRLVPVTNLKEGLALLSRGDVYAYVDALAPGSHGIALHGFKDIHVVGETPFRYDMSMAASKHHPELASILRKALKAIPPGERDRYFQKWATIPFRPKPDYSMVWKVLAGASVLLFIFLYWNRRLAQEVSGRRRVEAALREANEKLELRVERRTAELEARNVALAEEVIERKRVEAALRESEERFFKAFSLSPAPMVISDIDSGRFIDVNEQWVRMLGYTQEETIGETSYEQGIWEDPEVRSRLGQRLRETGSFRDEPVRFITKSGETRDALWSAEKVNLGGSEVMLSLIYDFTERKRAEDALRTSEERLRLALSAANQGFYDLNVQTGEAVVSPEYARMLGYEPESFRESSAAWRDRLHPDDRESAYQAFRDYIEGRRGDYRLEFRQRTKSGDWKWILSHGRILERDEDGKPLRMLGTHTDITERKRIEQERIEMERRLLHAQKLESLGVLAGGIAHDFNNLLMAIMGYADLALIEASPLSPARSSIEEILKASQRAADLCRQMLAYSGRGKFVIEPIHLSDVVRETVHMLKTCISKKVGLRLSLADHLPFMEGDPSQIRQVLMNLVINASEAIGEKDGVITVSTAARTCDAAYLQENFGDESLPEGVYVVLEVSDTGCGMDRETRMRIFEPFFTTKFTGRGLGMSAVLGIVRGHRGALKVYSEPERGSTFRLFFPASAQAFHEAPVEEPGPLGEWQGSGTVLLVDDEEGVLGVGRSMLEKLGLSVITAGDGMEAVEIYGSRGGEISFVLLDLTMPRMNGEETLRELQKINPGVRVILSSGYSESDISLRFAGKGIAGFIQKPYQMVGLREVLSTMGIST